MKMFFNRLYNLFVATIKSKINPLVILLLSAIFYSCGNSSGDRNVQAIRDLAARHVSDLKASQILEEYLLSVDNDTVALCYTLVMPKQSLERLIKEETYPTSGGLEKIQQSLVNRYVYGMVYVDSCVNDKKDDKDWLINNSVNEPVNPIWEQIAHE